MAYSSFSTSAFVFVTLSTTSLNISSSLSDRTQQLGKRPERPLAVQLYQNVPLHNLGNVRMEYLLARLAWTFFPCLEAFLLAGEKRNLTVLDDDKVRTEEN